MVAPNETLVREAIDTLKLEGITGVKPQELQGVVPEDLEERRRYIQETLAEAAETLQLPKIPIKAA